MDGMERRNQILTMLQQKEEPVSGTELAKRFAVSRQIIVGDIALLRAGNKNILSTTRGYILYTEEENQHQRVFHVSHNGEQIVDELNTFVDCGGQVLDVIVEHEVYGQIAVDLILKSRADIQSFVKKIEETKAAPLMGLTNGTHFHTVSASSEEVLTRIENELQEKGYLISE